MGWRIGALAGIFVCGAFGAAADEATPFPQHAPATSRYSAVGLASWYGGEFNGHKTADGETFNMASVSAAHRTMPLPCYARVTNLRNSHSIVVRVNDRGPFVGSRIMDVSARAAQLLGFNGLGVAKVRVEYLGKAAPAGTDERALLASLRTGEAPAIEPPAPLAKRPAPGPVEGALLAGLRTGDANGADPAMAEAPISPAAVIAATSLSIPPLSEVSAYAEPAGPPAADDGVSVIERAVKHTAALAAPKSPYGELILAPFVVRTAATP